MHARSNGKSARAVRGGKGLSYLVEGLESRQLMSVSFSGPIRITSGGTYTGNWQSTDVNTPAVSIETTQSVTIINSNIRGPGDLISANAVSGSKVTVLNTTGTGTNPNVNGKSKGSFLGIYEGAQIDVEHCDIEGVAYGVFVNHYGGNHTASQSIKILYNRVHNMDGRFSDGNGGYQNTGDHIAHFVIIDEVLSVPGIDIGWNQIINDADASLVEENINVFISSGTASSPILIHDNFIQGAYYPLADPKGYSGGGIIADGVTSFNASTTTAYVNIYNNQVTRTGNGGISLATGHDISIYNNRVVSAGVLPDGRRYTSTHATGVVKWDPDNNIANGTYFNNRIFNNISGLVRDNGNGGLMRSDFWMPTATAGDTGNTSWATTPSVADEAAEFALWQQKLANNRITLGTDSGPIVPVPVFSTSGLLIEAESFDSGGEGIGYHDLDSANLGGANRASEGVDIESSSDAGGGYDIGWIKAGEWQKYTIDAAGGGAYDLALRLASPVSGGKMHVELDGANITGSINVPNTGGWQKWSTVTISGVNVGSGVHVLKVAYDTNGSYGFVGNLNWLKFSKAAAASQTIQAEDFIDGGEGVAYHDTDDANSGGQYRSGGVDIEKTSDVGGGYSLGWTHAGEWVKYNTTVAAGGAYNLDFRVASNGTGGTFHLEVDGVDVTGAMTIQNTGGWQNWATITASSVNLSAGTHTMKLVFDTNGTFGFAGNINYIRLNPAA